MEQMNNEDDAKMEYVDVLDSFYRKAEIAGIDRQEDAWLFIDDAVWYPNPFYKGESVIHPECIDDPNPGPTLFHPVKPHVTPRERYAKYLEEKDLDN